MFDVRLLMLGIGIALGTLLVLFVVKVIVDRRRERRERRLNHFADSESSFLLEGPAPTEPLTWDQRMDRKFERMIERTGLEMNTEQALGYVCLAGVWIAGLLMLWRGQVWLGLLGLGLGSLVVMIFFVFMQRRYRRKLMAQLPDAFYLLARSLRAGLSLEQGIKLLGEESEKPLASEFKRCAGQIQLGMIAPVALQMMADRVQLVDFNAFVSAIGVHRVSGGNLALLLDRLAATSREHNEFRGYLQAATAHARASAIFIGLAGPFLLLMYAIFQPPHVVSFFMSPWGWLIVVLALLVQSLSALWLFRLLRVDY
jgi:tight adherence protein B